MVWHGESQLLLMLFVEELISSICQCDLRGMGIVSNLFG
jgi:hypothetical protein